MGQENFSELFNAIREARSGGAQAVKAGLSGVKAGTDQSLEARKLKLQEAVQALAAGKASADRENELVSQQQKDAEIGLAFAKARSGYPMVNQQTGQPVLDPKGKPVVMPGIEADYNPSLHAVTFGASGGKPVPTKPESSSGGQGATADPTALLSTLDRVEQSMATVPAGVLGAGTSLVAGVTGGAVAPDTKLYEDTKPAMAAGIYRAVTHDTRLSDADAASRAMPLMPSTYDSAELRKKKFAFLRQALADSAAGKTRADLLPTQPAGAPGGQPQTAPDSFGYVKGQSYRMKDGNTAVYKGNGEFE